MKKIIKLSLALAVSTGFLYGADATTEQDLENVTKEMKSNISEKKETNADGKSLSDKAKDFAIEKYNKKVDEWNQAESGVSLDVGAWYMMWDQTSDASNRFSDANRINMKYNIDDSMASFASLKGNYKLISAKLEYISTKPTSGSKSDDEMSAVSFGVFGAGLIPNIDVKIDYVGTKFKGSLEATKVSNNDTSSGTFETDLKIWDFAIYPYNKYVGVGYRKYKYEVPQDMYVVNNTTNAVAIAGLADIDYDGDFVTLTVDNKKQIEPLKTHSGVVYALTVGKGTLDASSVGYEQYLTKSDATFYDLSLAYNYKKKNADYMGYGFDIGYRYNSISTKANQEGSYSMITEFTSEFHGPFVNMVMSF